MGTQIQHRFMDEDGDLAWYDELVLNLQHLKSFI